MFETDLLIPIGLAFFCRRHGIYTNRVADPHEALSGPVSCCVSALPAMRVPEGCQATTGHKPCDGQSLARLRREEQVANTSLCQYIAGVLWLKFWHHTTIHITAAELPYTKYM